MTNVINLGSSPVINKEQKQIIQASWNGFPTPQWQDYHIVKEGTDIESKLERLRSVHKSHSFRVITR